MPLIKADRVKETSTSTGTGNFTLAGAATGFRTFASVCAVNDTVFYVIDSDSGSEWETGLGTYSSANTLTRTTVHASSNSGSLVPFSAGTKNVYISQTARQINTISAAPPASTGSPPSLIDVTGAAHTALTADTEYNDVYLNLARTVQFATSPSSIGFLRTIRILAPTYSFVGASSIGTAATVDISGAPVAGTNATISDRASLRVIHTSGATGIILQDNVVFASGSLIEARNYLGNRLFSISGYFGTTVIGYGAARDAGAQLSIVNGLGGNGLSISQSDNSADSINAFNQSGTKVFQLLGHGAINISPSAISGFGSVPSETITAPAHTALSASTEYNDIYWNLARTVQFSTGAITTQRAVRIAPPTYSFVGASTITNAVTFQIDGVPAAGANATITNRIGLRVLTGQASGKGIVIQGFSGQSGNLEEWQDSSGNILSAIRSNGAIQPATLADSAAANNSIYYSSTAGKLVYKDSAGTVNNLY